jgi:membrane protein DedA with SNARE-associated domain
MTQSTEYRQFLEETVLTVFLWVGIWGAISHLIDHYFKRYFYSEMVIYITIAAISFALLAVRGYVAKEESA